MVSCYKNSAAKDNMGGGEITEAPVKLATEKKTWRLRVQLQVSPR